MIIRKSPQEIERMARAGEVVADVLALLVGAVREADAALLMVTHDEGAAAQADRTLTLADGVVV